jgi:hypothetical protein
MHLRGVSVDHLHPDDLDNAWQNLWINSQRQRGAGRAWDDLVQKLVGLAPFVSPAVLYSLIFRNSLLQGLVPSDPRLRTAHLARLQIFSPLANH